jgi:TolA-binding protein
MDPLERMTRTVARRLGDGPGPERRARQRIAVTRMARRPARASGRWRWVVPVVAVALMLLWVGVGRSLLSPTPGARVGEQALMAGSGEPQRGEGTHLGPGQRLASDDEAVADGTPALASEPAGCVGAACAPERARPRPEVRRRESWAALADAGEHAAALAEAERQGFAGLLERLDAEGLDRLAHSARLAGAGARAREALLALRRRFPRSSRAGTAAFVLARIAVDLERDAPAAIAWLGRYLEEHPDGPLAEEARGRLLRALHDEGELARAHAAADDYLRHHPHGSHATLARTILGP